MADFKLTRRRKKSDHPQEPVAPNPEQSRSLLAKAGGAAMSGLHTIGSVLSYPSRLTWGTINGLAGGEGGYGNRSILDSTGGIELSHVLGNAGIIPKNDPSKWEAMDPVRGLIDIAGDPTTVLAPLGLTRAGVAANRSGTMVPGVLNQIRQGQRGLVGLQAPLSTVSRGAVGTGANVADALETVGNATRIAPLARAVGQSAPARHARALFDARFAGKSHPAIQRTAAQHDEARRAAQRQIDRDVFAMSINHNTDQLTNATDPHILRDVLEGIQNPHATPAHLNRAAEMQRINNSILAQDQAIGIRTGQLADDDVTHFPRRLLEGVEAGGERGVEMAANIAHGREDLYKRLGGTNAINRMLQDPQVDAAIQAAAHLPIHDQVAAAAQNLAARFPNASQDQIEHFAGLMVHVPEVRTQGLFGNHPLHDLRAAATAANNRFHWANLVYDSMHDQLHGGPHGVNVHQFLNAAGYDPAVAAGHIAQRSGRTVDDVLASYIPDELANQLRTLTPSYRVPPSHSAVGDAVKSLGTIWKASVLAHPASRVRDFVSGAIQNVLTGHSGTAGFNEARNIAHAAPLAGDYSHIPEVQDLITRYNLSPDDAVKAVLAVEAPRAHGAVSDIAPGQIGAQLQDILDQIPGRQQSGFREVMQRAGRSLRHGELDRNGVPYSQGSVLNPANVRGALDRVVSGEPRQTTAFGPAAASNVVSGAGDEFNRHSAILGQMQQGTSAGVAGDAARRAQVDYNPENFTSSENVLKQLMPFYSFSSRMGSHTARELASNPGGRTAQLIKAEDRAHGQDPSLPDHVLSGTAIPLGETADGTKRLVTQMGLMFEPSVNILGSAVGGDLRGAGYDVLGMLNPLIKTPLEKITNQSFFRKGAAEHELTPNVAQTLANLGVMSGLRSEESGPVRFTGDNALEAAIQVSPATRLASSLRTATDTRKGISEKALNLLTGVKVSDVSPKAQSFTLAKRASDLAQSEGAKTRQDVYFSKQQLAELEKTNPKLAERQRALQELMNQLRAKSKSKQSIPKLKKRSGVKTVNED